MKLFFSQKTLIPKLFSVLYLTMVSIPSVSMPFNFTLEKIQIDIEKKYQNIKHISSEGFLKLGRENTIVFDVREKNEFNVSHIKGAKQVAPDVDNKEFIKKFSKQIKGKNIVFYCSVGRRSSALATRIKPLLEKQGVHEIYNLKGGVFNWHNQKRVLIQQGHPTHFIHPFNTKWGRLLEDKKSIKFTPETFLQKD